MCLATEVNARTLTALLRRRLETVETLLPDCSSHVTALSEDVVSVAAAKQRLKSCKQLCASSRTHAPFLLSSVLKTLEEGAI